MVQNKKKKPAVVSLPDTLTNPMDYSIKIKNESLPWAVVVTPHDAGIANGTVL